MKKGMNEERDEWRRRGKKGWRRRGKKGGMEKKGEKKGGEEERRDGEERRNGEEKRERLMHIFKGSAPKSGKRTIVEVVKKAMTLSVHLY
jgi:hypothetical protein